MTADTSDIFTTLVTSKLCAREGCGCRFVPYRSYQRFCSAECRGKSHGLKAKVSLSIDADLIDALQVEGKRLDRSLAWMVAFCVKRALSRVEEPE